MTDEERMTPDDEEPTGAGLPPAVWISVLVVVVVLVLLFLLRRF